MQKSLRKAESHLRAKDSVMAALIDQYGPCTLYESSGLLHKSHFHVLAWAIINQQLSVQSARSIEQKLLSSGNSDAIDPALIRTLSDKKLAACGLSRQKIRYLQALCSAVECKQIVLEQLCDEDTSTIYNKLIKLPGIGPWTIDMFLMFSLGRLDVLPLGDLALRKSFAAHYRLPEHPEVTDYLKIAHNWQPYQSIASWYLWAAVD